MTAQTEFAAIPLGGASLARRNGLLPSLTRVGALVAADAGLSFACKADGRLPRDRLSAAIINCLRQARGGIVSRYELSDWIYGDDPNGGASWSAVRVTICQLRKAGFPITANHTRGFSMGFREWEVSP
jgi:hypothetical protein